MLKRPIIAAADTLYSTHNKNWAEIKLIVDFKFFKMAIGAFSLARISGLLNVQKS